LRNVTSHMDANFDTVSPSSSLSDQVAQALVTEIRSGAWAAGDKLPTEAVLVSQFGVSRTVVREAISRLKSLGLVDSRQGSGVFVKAKGVAPLQFDNHSSRSKQAVVQMVEVRRALEAEVAALAAQRGSPADMKRIKLAAQALDLAVQRGGDGVAEDMALHRAIADAAQNQFLISTLDYLRQFLQGATRVTRANEARRADFAKQVQREHLAIIEAIASADASKARKAAARHMDNAIKRIEAADPIFWQQEGVKLAGSLVRDSSAG
jgi:GntR family transcriptional regulator, transcriptional repressor for pyruvate dehydrogenase complex